MTTTTSTPGADASGFPTTLPGAVADTLMWADPQHVEPAALEQLRTISRLPWVHGLRVMPDVHLGKGATVGSVVAMRDAVSPAAVGVDIGCGMTAVRTDLTTEDLPEDLRSLRHAVERAVPVGFHAHDVAPDVDRLGLGRGRTSGRGTAWDWRGFWAGFRGLHDAVQDREAKAMKQMGTLGGGNHFIEVTCDDTGRVWLMLHSGSRNIGKLTELPTQISHTCHSPQPDWQHARSSTARRRERSARPRHRGDRVCEEGRGGLAAVDSRSRRP